MVTELRQRHVLIEFVWVHFLSLIPQILEHFLSDVRVLGWVLLVVSCSRLLLASLRRRVSLLRRLLCCFCRLLPGSLSLFLLILGDPLAGLFIKELGLAIFLALLPLLLVLILLSVLLRSICHLRVFVFLQKFQLKYRYEN